MDEAAPPISIAEVTSRAGNLEATGKDSSAMFVPRRLWLAGVAAAVAVLATIAIARPYRNSNTTTETVGEGAVELGDWIPVDDPSRVFVPAPDIDRNTVAGVTSISTSEVSIEDIVSLEDSLVAVGSDSIGSAMNAAVWTSSDGVIWSRQGETEPVLLADVEGAIEAQTADLRMVAAATDGDRLVVVGERSVDERDQVPVVWLRDGNEWHRTDLPHDSETGLVSVIDVVYAPGGFVAVGGGDRVRVWRSPEGREWTATTNTGFEPGDHVSTVVVDLDGDRMLAAGHTGGHPRSAAAMWISDDGGRTWIAAASPPGSPNDPVSRMVALGVRNGVIVAIGERSATGELSYSETDDGDRTIDDEQHLAVWSTVDDNEWQELAELGGDDEILWNPLLSRDPSGYVVAYSMVTVDEERSVLWRLSDDGTLAELPYPDGAGTEPRLLEFVGSEHLLVTGPTLAARSEAVGSGGPQPGPRIWRLPGG